MNYDLIIQNALISSNKQNSEPTKPTDIGVLNRQISAIGDLDSSSATTTFDADGQLVCPGFTESHIHLDKACILDRCCIQEGTLSEAVEQTSAAKEKFTFDDVYERASQVVQMAIKQGTMHLRSFVETDPKTDLISFDAIKQVRVDYAQLIDIQICAFAQEGLTDQPKTQALIKEALSQGADLIGGCPYKDTDPDAHIELIFKIAREFDVDVDFHLDFDLDASDSSIPKVVEQTRLFGYEGRVSIGHVTKLCAMDDQTRSDMITQLTDAGVALIVLPATDLFLGGRDAAASNEQQLVPRGMVNAADLLDAGGVASISSNNIQNAFTPYGDASLLRMANLYANVAQLASDDQIQQVFAMISEHPAKILGIRTQIEVGAPADLLVLEAKNPVDALRSIAQPLAGFKAGRMSFSRPAAKIYR